MGLVKQFGTSCFLSSYLYCRIKSERIYIMRSLERSHKGKDLDWVDPEQTKRLTAAISWDDLRKIPFSGNRQQSSENATDSVKSLKGLINSLPTDDETIRPNEVEEARRRVQDVFQRMDNVGSFGKNFRSGNMPSTNEESDKKLREANKDDSSSQSLLDISNTF